MSARKTAWLGGLAVVLATIVVVAAVRWSGPPIYDGDGWYHIKYASVLRHDGIARTFPWFQESFLKTRFTDFNLLYHLLLVPFTFGDLPAGARVATVLFAGATMGLFWGTARALRIPWPALWSLALLALAPDTLFRLTFTRPVGLAIGFAIAGTGAILLGKRRVAFAIAFLYTHLHCSFHLLPCVALLHDVVGDRPEGEGATGRFRMTLWTLGGVAAGCLLTPYFPNNLHMWWVTNIEVLRASWAMGDALRVGTEMMPFKTNELFAVNAGVFAVFGATIYLLAVGRRRASSDTRTLLPVAMGFLALAFQSARFIEWWAPFTFLLGGVAARDTLPDPSPWPRGARRLAVSTVAVAILAVLARTVATDADAAAAEDPPRYIAAGEWIQANVPAGETIFHLGWDEFPELFFADATHNYLIGQDATFMWVTDPARTRLWTDIAYGRVPDVYAAIHDTFRCRFAFVPSHFVTFLKLVRRDPRFVPRFRTASTTVFELRDRRPLVRDWSVTGAWPDPARRMFETPLGSEPPGKTVAMGGVDGFLDIDRALEVPPLWADVCAVARATYDAASAQEATIGITSDDAVRVYVNGVAAYEQSPFLHPPPGMPGGPPLALSVLAGGVGGIAEQAFGIRWETGSNTIAVKTCRYGGDFGFVLLLADETGSWRPSAASTTRKP